MTSGQLSFEGREVSAIKTRWGDLEMDSLPTGLDHAALAGLKMGDEIECVVRFKVEDIGHSEKTDRFGVGTKPLTRTVRLKTLFTGFAVRAVKTKAELDAAWAQEHSA